MVEATNDRTEELLELFRELVRSVETRPTASPTVGRDQQTALFAYQWINGHLGRSDVVAPVVGVERRKGGLRLHSAPAAGAVQAVIFAEDGSVEQIAITDPAATDLRLALADAVAIEFVEFRTEHGAPVAIVHRIPGI
jgi:hypothetical protein